MRKTICTSTIFAGFLGLLYVGCFVRMPDQVWWLKNPDPSPNGMPHAVWALLNIGSVLSLMVLAGFGVYCLWNLAETICSKLRGDR